MRGYPSAICSPMLSLRRSYCLSWRRKSHPISHMPTTILTLRLDNQSQKHFEALRQAHYPPALNQIPAHLTLFHQLPETDSTLQTLHELATAQPAFPLTVKGLRNLGRGVAYELASATLLDLHRSLAACFEEDLTRQDRQRFQPHIVVQNKATSGEARALLKELQSVPFPPRVRACGLDLWRYLDGPWMHLQTFPFQPAELAE